MDVLRRHMPQVNIVYFRTVFQIQRHPRRRCDVIHGKLRRSGQLCCAAGAANELSPRRQALPMGIRLPDLLNHLEEPGPAWDAVGFQGGGYRQADGLLRAAAVRHHQIRVHGIQPPLHAFNRGIEGFQIDCHIDFFRFRHPQPPPFPPCPVMQSPLHSHHFIRTSVLFQCFCKNIFLIFTGYFLNGLDIWLLFC